jgi:hypothetical protein
MMCSTLVQWGGCCNLLAGPAGIRLSLPIPKHETFTSKS